ncbi:BolA family transcriptional regulator [Grimontia hollisae]|uniref:DNA-binding transcriptional regulator BolA n=2 Tax=Grimontia hollisae TaxID=673 RepID=D0I7L2_GRIHO|nr:BolA/IbaG family iron-sulfur metabolism protein [Grimontia hollisae]AMG31227.1 BolA family transcriptional regulator [Grimontia hollisae]EEY72631.1 cell division protein BolA [Grimontia hollisae CIP 101886]STO46207.1 transcriptional regulator BolA [Grimontia hollisae]STO58219.1 transcriptional regulator BolA [Grimontia hollisae]STQ76743.1 transcriptional regulator BolA [Grimontia hollisae]
MSVQKIIEQKLSTTFSPLYLDVKNESYMHNVPEGAESHFKVTIVSRQFEGLRLISRHRAVNQTLSDELQNAIHALAIHTYTEGEWHDLNGQAPMSPPCHGGSMVDTN